MKQFNNQKQLTNTAHDYQWRRDKLKSLLKVVRAHVDELAQAAEQDFGVRSQYETKLLELVPIIEEIKCALVHLKKWLKPQKKSVPIWLQLAKAYLYPQPKGVVGIVVPWNYPILLALAPLINAIAAGNRVMIKTSELAPAVSSILKKILQKVFTADEVCIIEGGVDVAKEFVKLPFDHLFFTGSTKVGKEVMRAAACNLTPVTLELGGKSPVIIDENCNFKQAVNSILTGKLFNSGQTCVAPDYVFLPNGLEDSFIELAKEFIKAHSFTTNIISKDHYKRLEKLILDAKKYGGKVTQIGEANSDQHLSLTIIMNTSDEMACMGQEIFGPILPIITYKNIKEVIDYINVKDKPLALYIFSKNKKFQKNILQNTQSGGVTINDTLLHAGMSNLPFGGIGASGMGSYHGYEGFAQLSHFKPVFHQSKFNGFKLMRPPMKRWAKSLLSFIIRG